jgi:lipopolysaccharide transport system permease protein
VKRIFGAWVSITALAWRLFARTIGAKYRKSYLGYFWMVFPALLITVGVTLASSAGVINPGDTVLPYPLFVLFGTLIWQVFAEAVDVPYQAFEGARSYLTRVHFPRESIIVAQLFESLITTAVRMLVALLLLALAYGIDWRAVGLVSLSFAGTVLIGLGVGALLMPFTLLFADLHNTIKLILSYGLFLTPAMYQPPSEGVFSVLLRLNPVWPLMDAARDGAAGVPLSHPLAFVIVLCAAVLTTIGGFVMVRASAPIVIERMLLGGR